MGTPVLSCSTLRRSMPVRVVFDHQPLIAETGME